MHDDLEVIREALAEALRKDEVSPLMASFMGFMLNEITDLRESIVLLKESSKKPQTMSRRDRLFATHIGKRGTK